MFPLGAILDIGSKLVDKFFPDPQQAEQAKLKLLEMQQTGELAQLNADVAEQHELTERHLRLRFQLRRAAAAAGRGGSIVVGERFVRLGC